MNLFGLAVGATSDLALCNSAGIACLPLIAAALAIRPSLEAAAAGGLASEVFALAFTHRRLRRHYGEMGHAALRTASLLCVSLVAIPVWTVSCQPGLGERLAVALAGIAALATTALPGAWPCHQPGMDVEPASNLIQS